MILNLFETHLDVSNLERSENFYKEQLGLEVAHRDTNRKVVFFWIGKPGAAMLGLWEKEKSKITKSHFAFSCYQHDILLKSKEYLLSRNIKPYNFLNDGSQEPIVFAWMPAISLYFDDPDGHCLELISMIPGSPNKDLGVISYPEWIKANAKIRSL